MQRNNPFLAGILKEPGKVISFHCPQAVLDALNQAADELGPGKRSRVIVAALQRFLPILRRQIIEKPSRMPQDTHSRMERLSTLPSPQKRS